MAFQQNGAATLRDVEAFWNSNPLFTGEGSAEPGSLEWFQEWEDVIIQDCFAWAGPEPVFTKGLKPDSRILDVGCGPGFWVRHFLKNGFGRVSACDLTQSAVDLANKGVELFGLEPAPEIRVGNAEALPYEDESFDHVNCQGVIHHTPNTQKCIDEFHRVLKPGGAVCFSVYYKTFFLRHPLIMKLAALAAQRFVSLKGRGRERILSSGNPEEIVRLYDGADNPLGKCYTFPEIQGMLGGRFRVDEVKRSFFPARALPVKVSKPIHKWLHNHCGLMIVVRAIKAQ